MYIERNSVEDTNYYTNTIESYPIGEIHDNPNSNGIITSNNTKTSDNYDNFNTYSYNLNTISLNTKVKDLLTMVKTEFGDYNIINIISNSEVIFSFYITKPRSVMPRAILRVYNTFSEAIDPNTQINNPEIKAYKIIKDKPETQKLFLEFYENGEANVKDNLDHFRKKSFNFEENKDLHNKTEYLILEPYAWDLQSLIEYYAKNNKKFNENIIIWLIDNIVQCLVQLKAIKIAHRDIKPSNIILKENPDEKSLIFTLKDFSKCHIYDQSEDLDGMLPEEFILVEKIGTDGYMAPEIHSKKHQQVKLGRNSYYDPNSSAIFALAASILHMLPIDLDPQDLIKNIKAIKIEKIKKSINDCKEINEDLKDLLIRMLDKSTDSRISLEDLVEGIQKMRQKYNYTLESIEANPKINYNNPLSIISLYIPNSALQKNEFNLNFNIDIKSNQEDSKEEEKEKEKEKEEENLLKVEVEVEVNVNSRDQLIKIICNKTNTGDMNGLIKCYYKEITKRNPYLSSNDFYEFSTILACESLKNPINNDPLLRIFCPELKSIQNESHYNLNDGSGKISQIDENLKKDITSLKANVNNLIEEDERLFITKYGTQQILIHNDSDNLTTNQVIQIYAEASAYNSESHQLFPKIYNKNGVYLIFHGREILSLFTLKNSKFESFFSDEKYEKILKRDNIIKILKQLLKCLTCLKINSRIAHLDINLRSIQLNEKGDIILSHFEKAYQYISTAENKMILLNNETLTNYSIRYLAPEIKRNNTDTLDPFSVDIYALAVSIIQIILQSPFPPEDPIAELTKLQELETKDSLYLQVLYLLEIMLNPNPIERMTSERLLCCLEILEIKYYNAEIWQLNKIESHNESIQNIIKILYGTQINQEKKAQNSIQNEDDSNEGQQINEKESLELRYANNKKISKNFQNDHYEMSYIIYLLLSSQNSDYFEHIVYENDDYYYLSNEFRNLQKLIQTRLDTKSAKYKYTDVNNALKNLVIALYILYTLKPQKIAHRNINTKNICLNDNQKFILIGFDHAYLFEDDKELLISKQYNKKFNKDYAPPDNLSENLEYDPSKADIYSLGVCLIQMAQTSSEPPSNPLQTVKELLKTYANEPFICQILGILELMVADYDQRIDIESLKQFVDLLE